MDHKDVLTEVFSTLRLRSSLYFLARLRGDFSVEVPPESRRIRFHFVREGRCWLRMAEGQARELTAGDIAIVPNGAGQVLSSDPELAPLSLQEVLQSGGLQQGILSFGEGERKTRLLCGFCCFDEEIEHPVLMNLPAIIVLRPEELGREPWITAVLRVLSLESELDEQGGGAILTRLLEILFVQAVRRMQTETGDRAEGFIAALSDRQLSRALHAMHSAPQRNWKVHELAAEAGMSRARFAQRFAETVGSAPMGYLTRWRLIKARELLVNSNLDMTEIAARCGYASAPSFARRFKESLGLGPGAYRRAGRIT